MTFVGLCLPQLGEVVDVGLIRDYTVRSHQLGFDSLWVQEHFLFATESKSAYPTQSGGVQRSVYETVYSPLELLGAVTAWAPGMGIGTSILVAGYHYPAPLANRLATLAQLSGGRLIAGFGVGWSREEHAAAGVDASTRGKRLDEFIPALRACWEDDPIEFHSPMFDIAPGVMRPKPPRPIPLMAGMWSDAGLRRTARDFDLWNPGGPAMSLDEAEEKLALINSWRPEGKAPVGMVYRLATESASGIKLGVDGVVEYVHEARRRGIDGVVIDTNFDTSVTDAASWLAQLEDLAGALE
ncbi:TIGR03619 family F420-dependent LLM class oxidoreductase [Agromyces aerolatus]|uniref:TIGR03619 family F420-dependent LLM class oxidoreductase n=1 Tax=Agromyces sp. LY-1074 TaxID=3074080 RepID=UPI002858AF60|nr:MULTISPECIES: TIGR03619 family F420-dependent LLM class oxidoreductase [unclassified Agromyces]MDR5699100.1 TIGR03619 family F420-dependent LLM class oxidoreductase [Agromyces sp. LY-1074]MDR5705121.1 TIGR03619 family F420-dependent LLM class oxidoreductase [Agromyces sp. LY-1358]